MSPRRLVLVALLPLSGCALLPPWGEDEEREAAASGESLSVVPDDRPFDPSAVVEGEEGSASQGGADEARARLREEATQRAVERVDEAEVDDDRAKAELASNPPSEAPGQGEGWLATVLDWVMEGVLVLALSAVLSAPLWLLARAGRRRADRRSEPSPQ